ncbi:MAG: hypothetical protein ACPLOU_01515 [bacterium]
MPEKFKNGDTQAVTVFVLKSGWGITPGGGCLATLLGEVPPPPSMR